MSELEKQMLLLVKSSCLDTEYQLNQQWCVSSVENIEKASFLADYELKRLQMKQSGRRDDETIDRCVFVCYNNKDRVTRVVQNGITVSTTSINYIGNCAKGVLLCRHADVLLKVAAIERKDRCWLIVCKAMFGRVSHVVGSDTILEPAFWADSHLIGEALSPNDNLIKQALNSQVFMYETEASSPTGYAVRPRQCVPLACIEFSPSSSRLSGFVDLPFHLSSSGQQSLSGRQAQRVEEQFSAVASSIPNVSQVHGRLQNVNSSTCSQPRVSSCSSNVVRQCSVVNNPLRAAVLLRPCNASAIVPTRPSAELTEQIRLLKVHHQLVISLLQTFVGEMNAVVHALQRLRSFASISVPVETALQTLVRLRTNFRDLSTKCQHYLSYLSQVNSMQPGLQLASVDVLTNNVESLSRCCSALLEIFRELRQWMTPSVEIGLYLSSALFRRAPDVTRQLQIFSSSLAAVVPDTSVCSTSITVPVFSTASCEVPSQIQVIYQLSHSTSQSNALSSGSHCTGQPIVIQPDGQLDHEEDLMKPLPSVNVKMEALDNSLEKRPRIRDTNADAIVINDLISSTVRAPVEHATYEEPTVQGLNSTLQETSSSEPRFDDMDCSSTHLKSPLLSNAGHNSNNSNKIELLNIKQVKSESSLHCDDNELPYTLRNSVNGDTSVEQAGFVSTSTVVGNDCNSELEGGCHRIDNTLLLCAEVICQRISDANATTGQVNDHTEEWCMGNVVESLSSRIETSEVESSIPNDTCGNAALIENLAGRRIDCTTGNQSLLPHNNSVNTNTENDVTTLLDNSDNISSNCAEVDISNITVLADKDCTSSSVTTATVSSNSALHCSSIGITSCHASDVNDICTSVNQFNDLHNVTNSGCELDVNSAPPEPRVTSTLTVTKQELLSVEVSTDKRLSLFFELNSATKMELKNDMKNIISGSEDSCCKHSVCTLQTDNNDGCSALGVSQLQVSYISDDATGCKSSVVTSDTCNSAGIECLNASSNIDFLHNDEWDKTGSSSCHSEDVIGDESNTPVWLQAADTGDTHCRLTSSNDSSETLSQLRSTDNRTGVSPCLQESAKLESANSTSDIPCRLQSVDDTSNSPCRFQSADDIACKVKSGDETVCTSDRFQSTLPLNEVSDNISEIIKAVIGVIDTDCESSGPDVNSEHVQCQPDSKVICSNTDSDHNDQLFNSSVCTMTMHDQRKDVKSSLTPSSGDACCNRVLEDSGVFRISSVFSVKDVDSIQSQVSSDVNDQSITNDECVHHDVPVESDDFILAIRAFSRMAKVFFELRDSPLVEMEPIVKQEVADTYSNCVDTSQENINNSNLEHINNTDFNASSFSAVVKVEEPEFDELNLSKTIAAIQDIVAQNIIPDVTPVIETQLPNCKLSVTNKVKIGKKRKKRKRFTNQKNKKCKVPVVVTESVAQSNEKTWSPANTYLQDYCDATAGSSSEVTVSNSNAVDIRSLESVSEVVTSEQPADSHSISTKETGELVQDKRTRKRKLNSLSTKVKNLALSSTESLMKRRSMTLTAKQNCAPPCPVDDNVDVVHDSTSKAGEEINSENTGKEITVNRCMPENPGELSTEPPDDLINTNTPVKETSAIKKIKKKKQRRRRSKKKTRAVSKLIDNKDQRDTGLDIDNDKEHCTNENESDNNSEVEVMSSASAISKPKMSAKDKVNAMFRSAEFTCLHKVSSTALCKRDNKHLNLSAPISRKSNAANPVSVESAFTSCNKNLKLLSEQHDQSAICNTASRLNYVASARVEGDTGTESSAPIHELSYSEQLSIALDNSVRTGVSVNVNTNSHNEELKKSIQANVNEKLPDTVSKHTVPWSMLDEGQEGYIPVYYTGIMQNYIPKLMSLYVEPTGTSKVCSQPLPPPFEIRSVSTRDPRVKVHADVQHSMLAKSSIGQDKRWESWKLSLPVQTEEHSTTARRVSYEKYVTQCLNKNKSSDNAWVARAERCHNPVSDSFEQREVVMQSSVPMNSFEQSEQPKTNIVSSDILSDLSVDESLTVPTLSESDWHCAKRVIRCASGLERETTQKTSATCHVNSCHAQVPLDCPSFPEYPVLTESELLALNDLEMVDQPLIEDVDLVLKFPAIRMNGMFWNLIPLDTVHRACTVYKCLRESLRQSANNARDVDPRLCWRPMTGSFSLTHDQTNVISWEELTVTNTDVHVPESSCMVREELNGMDKIRTVVEPNSLRSSPCDAISKDTSKSVASEHHTSDANIVLSNAIDTICGKITNNEILEESITKDHKALKQIFDQNFDNNYYGDFQLEEDVVEESDGTLMIDLECDYDNDENISDDVITKGVEDSGKSIIPVIENSSVAKSSLRTSNMSPVMKSSTSSDMTRNATGYELYPTSGELTEKISNLCEEKRKIGDIALSDCISKDAQKLTSASDTDTEKEKTYDHISKQFQVVVSKLHNSRRSQVLVNTKKPSDAFLRNSDLTKGDLKLNSDVTVSAESSDQSSSDMSFLLKSITSGERLPAKAVAANVMSNNNKLSGLVTLCKSVSTKAVLCEASVCSPNSCTDSLSNSSYSLSCNSQTLLASEPRLNSGFHDSSCSEAKSSVSSASCKANSGMLASGCKESFDKISATDVSTGQMHSSIDALNHLSNEQFSDGSVLFERPALTKLVAREHNSFALSEACVQKADDVEASCKTKRSTAAVGVEMLNTEDVSINSTAFDQNLLGKHLPANVIPDDQKSTSKVASTVSSAIHQKISSKRTSGELNLTACDHKSTGRVSSKTSAARDERIPSKHAADNPLQHGQKSLSKIASTVPAANHQIQSCRDGPAELNHNKQQLCEKNKLVTPAKTGEKIHCKYVDSVPRDQKLTSGVKLVTKDTSAKCDRNFASKVAESKISAAEIPSKHRLEHLERGEEKSACKVASTLPPAIHQRMSDKTDLISGDLNTTSKTESRSSSAGGETTQSKSTSAPHDRKSNSKVASTTKNTSTVLKPGHQILTSKAESSILTTGCERIPNALNNATSGDQKLASKDASTTPQASNQRMPDKKTLTALTSDDQSSTSKTGSRSSAATSERMRSKSLSVNSIPLDRKSTSKAALTSKNTSTALKPGDTNLASKAESCILTDSCDRMQNVLDKVTVGDRKSTSKDTSILLQASNQKVHCKEPSAQLTLGDPSWTGKSESRTIVDGSLCSKRIADNSKRDDRKSVSEVTPTSKDKSAKLTSVDQNLTCKAESRTLPARPSASEKSASGDRKSISQVASTTLGENHGKIFIKDTSTVLKSDDQNLANKPEARASASGGDRKSSKFDTLDSAPGDCKLNIKVTSIALTSRHQSMTSKNAFSASAQSDQNATQSRTLADGGKKSTIRRISADEKSSNKVVTVKLATGNGKSSDNDKPAKLASIDWKSVNEISCAQMTSDYCMSVDKDESAACDQKSVDKPVSTKSIARDIKTSVKGGFSQSFSDVKRSKSKNVPTKLVECYLKSCDSVSQLQALQHFDGEEQGYRDSSSRNKINKTGENQHGSETLKVKSACVYDAMANNRSSDMVEVSVSDASTLPLPSCCKGPALTDSCKQVDCYQKVYPIGTDVMERAPATKEVVQTLFEDQCNTVVKQNCVLLDNSDCGKANLSIDEKSFDEKQILPNFPSMKMQAKSVSCGNAVRIRPYDPKSVNTDDEPSAKRVNPINLSLQTVGTKGEFIGDTRLKNIPSQSAGLLHKEISSRCSEENNMLLDLNKSRISLSKSVPPVEQKECGSFRVEVDVDYSSIQTTVKNSISTTGSYLRKQRLSGNCVVDFGTTKSSVEQDLIGNIDVLGSDADPATICDSARDFAPPSIKHCDFSEKLQKEIERREKTFIHRNIYSNSTSDLSHEEKKKLVAEHSLDPREEHELVVDLRLGTLQREVARIQDLMDSIKSTFDPSKPSASLDRRYDQFEQKQNYLIVRRDWNYSRLNKLHRYYKSHFVLVIPNELRIGSEREQYFSAEGVPLFINNMTISLKHCTRLAALAKSIIAHESRMKNGKDKLRWLHEERKDLLEEICCTSMQQRDCLIDSFSDKLTLYRCARLDIERRQDEKSCELREFVDETIERLQLYISLLRRARKHDDGTWQLTEDQKTIEDDAMNNDRLAKCHENMKLSKRQKILAVLNSVLEKKRKESSEGDVVDGSYHCSNSTSIEPVLEEYESVPLRSKNSRKRTMRENNLSLTNVKKPLLEAPSSFKMRFNVKTDIGAIGHGMERSGSSKSLLEDADYPAAKSGELFADSYSKFAGHLRPRYSMKEQKSLAPRLSQDSRPRFNRTSFRSGDRIRFPSSQTAPNIGSQECRETRVPIVRQQFGSRYHRDAGDYSSSMSPRFDELNVRRSMSPRFDELKWFDELNVRRSVSPRFDELNVRRSVSPRFDELNVRRSVSPQFDEVNVRVDRKRGLLGDCPPSSERLGLLGDAPRCSSSNVSSNFPVQDDDDDNDNYHAPHSFKQLSVADVRYRSRKQTRALKRYSPRSRYSHWPW